MCLWKHRMRQMELRTTKGSIKSKSILLREKNVFLDQEGEDRIERLIARYVVFLDENFA